MPDEVVLYIAIALAVAVAGLILLLFLEREKRGPASKKSIEPSRSTAEFRWPLSMSKTVTNDVVDETKDKLRILDLDREILSYAIRRLYEAQAEGKINEEERDRMALKYKEDLSRIKEEISRGESIVVLNELERMQEDFVKNFSDRFDALSKRIEELRAMSGFKQMEPVRPRGEEIREEKTETPLQDADKTVAPKKKKIAKPKTPGETTETTEPPETVESTEPEKSEAEKKVEQIMADVEKVLERLGQMEVEE